MHATNKVIFWEMAQETMIDHAGRDSMLLFIFSYTMPTQLPLGTDHASMHWHLACVVLYPVCVVLT